MDVWAHFHGLLHNKNMNEDDMVVVVEYCFKSLSQVLFSIKSSTRIFSLLLFFLYYLWINTTIMIIVIHFNCFFTPLNQLQFGCCLPLIPIIEWVATNSLAWENIRFSSLFAAGDVSRGGTSATQWQKFHTDDVKSVRNPVRRADWSAE